MIRVVLGRGTGDQPWKAPSHATFETDDPEVKRAFDALTEQEREELQTLLAPFVKRHATERMKLQMASVVERFVVGRRRR